jgi:hypothetical protein
MCNKICECLHSEWQLVLVGSVIQGLVVEVFLQFERQSVEVIYLPLAVNHWELRDTFHPTNQLKTICFWIIFISFNYRTKHQEKDMRVEKVLVYLSIEIFCFPEFEIIQREISLSVWKWLKRFLATTTNRRHCLNFVLKSKCRKQIRKTNFWSGYIENVTNKCLKECKEKYGTLCQQKNIFTFQNTIHKQTNKQTNKQTSQSKRHSNKQIWAFFFKKRCWIGIIYSVR